MKTNQIENFSSQADAIVNSYKRPFTDAQKALISKNNAVGKLMSGGTIRGQLDIANENMASVVNDSLEFALNYAGTEGISPDKTLDIAYKKLCAYKDEICGEVRKSPALRTIPTGVNKVIEDNEAGLQSLITDKVKHARTGWLNGKKIYSGNITSPSLILFNALCLSHDQILQAKAPKLKERFDASYINLESDNSSHWANAVHECRKIFEDLADSLLPAQTEPRSKNGKKIELGKAQYKNRLVCFVEDNSKSETYTLVVSNQLEDFIKKLEALLQATQKGSHADLTKEHAYSFVAYTYLLVGDILSLI